MQKFVRHYLGTAEAPIPFGGRGREIELMNRWFTARDGPSRMLVTAGAGRGKTALLVRWLHQLQTDVAVVFMPISIRFGTSQPKIFYEALAGRLADVVGEELSRTGGDAVEFYKEKVVEYFDRIDEQSIPCLVVIDGLDEATGWEFRTDLLPDYRVESLRVLVSARLMAGDAGDEGWRLRLGWQFDADDVQGLDVPPLDAAAIGDILVRTDPALAPLAKDAEARSTLARLTEGDPLLLSYFVADLRAQGDRPVAEIVSGLHARVAGFGPYFRNWIEEQKDLDAAGGDRMDDRITAILAIMASALGPLLFRDLVDLVARVHPVGEIITTDTMDKIGRFVLGDGIEGGYALGHPKLRDYLRRDFFGESRDVERSDQGYLDWGREQIEAVAAGRIEPDEMPGYLLNHYAQHLISAGAPAADLARLSSDAWRRAWMASPDGDGLRGLKADVEAALGDCLDRLARPRDVGAEIADCTARCVLAANAIDSLGLNVPTALVAMALSRGRIAAGQALQFVRRGNFAAEAFATSLILPYLDPNRRLAIEEELLAAIARQSRADALFALAPALDPEFHPEAVALAAGMQEAELLGRLARLADPALHDDLIDALGQIRPRPPEVTVSMVASLDDTRRQRLLDMIQDTGTSEEDMLVRLEIARLSEGDRRDAMVETAASRLAAMPLSKLHAQCLVMLSEVSPQQSDIEALVEEQVRDLEVGVDFEHKSRTRLLAPLMSTDQLSRSLLNDLHGAILEEIDTARGAPFIERHLRLIVGPYPPGDAVRGRILDAAKSAARSVRATELADPDSLATPEALDDALLAIDAVLQRSCRVGGSRRGHPCGSIYGRARASRSCGAPGSRLSNPSSRRRPISVRTAGRSGSWYAKSRTAPGTTPSTRRCASGCGRQKATT